MKQPRQPQTLTSIIRTLIGLNALLIFLTLQSACRKEIPLATKQPPIKENTNPAQPDPLIQNARNWYQHQYQQKSAKLHPDRIDWNSGKIQQTSKGSQLLLRLSGSPSFQQVKQGYRRLIIQLDSTTKILQGHILEVLPDAAYHQRKQLQDPKAPIQQQDFSGRIFRYGLDYQLQQGLLYGDGSPIGQARPANTAEKAAIAQHTQPSNSIGQYTQRPQSQRDQQYAIIGGCTWYTSTYIDSEGVFTVYAESFCSFSISYDMAYEAKTTIDDAGGGGGGGGYTDPGPPPPPPSNLPMEDQPKVDPKKLMDCFTSISSPNAAYQVKVLVQEPQPGTSFNVGTNGFGHVAIQLTKAAGGQQVTQTLGFYPTGSGFDKLVSPSRIIDNGGFHYNMSATMYTDAQSFQKLVDYIANPPKNYHYTDFNCAAFVHAAGKAAGLPIPDPTTAIGIGGPGGVATAMTPYGMAAALDQQKAANPSADISRASGRATPSKGECK